MSTSHRERFVLWGIAALLVLVGAGGVLRAYLTRDAAVVIRTTTDRVAASTGTGGSGGGAGAQGSAASQQDAAAPETLTLLVHISGAVQDPGVYRLPEGSHLVDALQAAGGPTSRADLDVLNLADPLVNGQKFAVPWHAPPVRGSTMAGRGQGIGATSIRGGGLISINRATLGDWVSLPGIGEKTAEKVIAHRTKQGGFRKIEDLLEVPGIGKKTLEKLRPYLSL